MLWVARALMRRACRYGIAALKTGSMLGCTCLDGTPLVVQCAIVGASISPTAFNVSWENEQQLLLKCSSVRIVVQSIRWSERRVLFAEQLASVPPSKELLAADAAVYVIPSCGVAPLLSCINQAVFTRSNCFPFCMALHTTSQQQASLILR